MAISKVVLNGTTLMDATTATATAEDIIAPKTALIATGEMAVGTGTLYAEAIDPDFTGRTYTETNQPIDDGSEESEIADKAEAYDILTGVSE